jgi:hypothetical protein
MEGMKIKTCIFALTIIAALLFLIQTPLAIALNKSSPATMKGNNSITEYPDVGKIEIGIVAPTFTAAAYNRAFYEFYHIYDPTVWVEGGVAPAYNKSVTTDLQLLTAKIPLHNASAYGYEIIRMVYNVKQLLPEANVIILTDGDIDEGRIFKTNSDSNSGNFYNILILGHQEYVTQKEYYNLKNFVAHGGTIILADPNIFYAEVSYNKAAQTVTLVKGHGWEFNGKSAYPSVFERWSNETSKWVGSNFYYWGGLSYNIEFKNNPFNYTHSEEQYITNPHAKIILNYDAVAPDYRYFGYPRPLIAAYQMSYKMGKVVALSIFSDTLIRQEGFFSDYNTYNKNFISVFDNLLLQNIPLRYHNDSRNH